MEIRTQLQQRLKAGWMHHTIQKYEAGPDYTMVVVTPSGLVKLAGMPELGTCG